MLTVANKVFLLLAGVALAVSVVYLFVSPDRAGVTVLLCTLAAVGLLAAGSIVGTGPAVLSGAGPQGSLVDHRARPSVWPAVAAIGAGGVVVGAAVGAAVMSLGLIVLAVAGVAWFFGVYRDHPNFLPKVSARTAERFTVPYGLPLVAGGLVAITALSLSRIFLAVSKSNSAVIAIVAAALILLVASITAARPRLDRRTVQALAVVAAVSVLALGAVGLAKGFRPFGEHEGGSEHVEKEVATAGEEGGAADTTVAVADEEEKK